MTRYFLGVSQEQFPPEALLEQAVAAEQAGFDGLSSSDHLQPWWEPGESGHTWPWLGAAGVATSKLPLGTGVTPTGARYHPALIAQAWVTLERLFPGRPFLGIGSGEALNEVPIGDDWPSVGRPDRAHGRGAVDHRPALEGRDDHRGRALLHLSGPQAAHVERAAGADLGQRVRAAGGRGRGEVGRRDLDVARPGVDARAVGGLARRGWLRRGRLPGPVLVGGGRSGGDGRRAQVEGRAAAGALQGRLARAGADVRARRGADVRRRALGEGDHRRRPGAARASASASSRSSARP